MKRTVRLANLLLVGGTLVANLLGYRTDVTQSVALGIWVEVLLRD